jgi:hypothetical protein
VHGGRPPAPVVIIAATDRVARDRYLRWLSQQGGGGDFAMVDTWVVGSDFESMARSAHDAIGGTVCILPMASAPYSIGKTSAPASPGAAHHRDRPGSPLPTTT